MSNFQVLIVEDQPFQLAYLENLFRDIGVKKIELAENGNEAMMKLESQGFDLILTDLMMPELDGIQFIQRLAELEVRPALAIMSTSSRKIMAGACLVANALGIDVLEQISKPVMPSAISALMIKLKNLSKVRPCSVHTSRKFSRKRLLSAISSGQLQAWFQPKKSLQNGSIVSAEALVRWVCPELGILQPGQFLKSIELAGLEEELLFLMIEQTVLAQACWLEQGFQVPVSINLSPHLLDRQYLPDLICEQVIRFGGSTKNICFELTEDTMPSVPSNYVAGACRLRMKGFGLSQDDFGNGYSSFYNLVATPFTELKIDRALIYNCVEDEGVASALKSIIKLGRELGLDVVAEGVETQEQLALLRQFECHAVQGFFISKAIPPDSFMKILFDDNPLGYTKPS
ncbi:EAL domain-containing response regulator [Pseudomonas fragi]|uniref:EAL domain-containing response regulator n=1 Tax=Pseudomonas fragi TaxID=296 RepID=UPI0021BFDA37|nr:EAL domain-containing response regulator [Pseudomonas fragi]UXL37071.1 EAL domain-containing response regulator [Pseudomonas fragi]